MSLEQFLEITSLSDPGMVRSHNEDSVATDAASGVVVLADGMGGYNAGEVASGIAVSLLSEGLRQALQVKNLTQLVPETNETLAHKVFKEQIAKANDTIYQTSQTQPQCAGMGTTLVVAAFYDNKMTVGHIGDSRMYRLRGDEFSQVTKDHSLLQEQIDAGIISKEDAKHSQNKNLVTRALGIDPTVDPELHDYDLLPDDIYLLCSDGLNDMVEDEDIGTALTMLRSNLSLAATQLIQMANDNGGKDNVSVILVRVLQAFPVKRSWISKLFSWFVK